MALRTADMRSASLVYGEVTPIDGRFFIAHRPCEVVAITGCPLVVASDGGAVTGEVRKVPSGTATASGTILHSGTYNLKGTINTNQSLTLVATSAVRLAAGDALAFDVTGTTTDARGVLTVAIVDC